MMHETRVFFFRPMPRDQDLLKRALGRSTEELKAELERVLADMRARLLEGGTPEEQEAKTRQIQAAERALARLVKKDSP